MRRVVVMVGLLGVLAAACVPQVAETPTEPVPPSCSMSIGVDGQHLEVSVSSTLAVGEVVQATLTGNGAPLIGYSLSVPGSGDFSTTLTVPEYGFPVTWVGTITRSSDELCTATAVTEPDALGTPVPITSASFGTGTFVVGDDLAPGSYTILAVGLDDPDDPSSEQCRFEIPTEDLTMYPDRGSIPWATTYATGPGAVVTVPVEATGYQVRVRAGCVFWLPN